MKKLFLILLSALVFLFTACDNWMQDDDFYNDIEEAVKVANAPQINVYTRYALTRQGKTEPEGYSIFKVGIPSVISATTEPEYGFVRWAAFTTDFVAPGDNQSKNKDIYYIDEEDYNTRLLPHELQAPFVVFGDAKSPTTTVIINAFQNDIFLLPVVAQRPAVSLTIPAKGSSGVVRNISVRINFTKPMNEESFKNEAGEYDKIIVTQGTQSFTADGDIEINSEDITSYFEPPVFSKNKKMVTLKFKPERLSEGYSSQSSINITISKDVKDVDGFTMADDDKISFSVGSNKDTLAPRITQLTAGRSGADFNVFQGVYKDAGTINSVGATTKITLEDAISAPTDDINATYFDTFIPYRIKDKLVLRVLAEDIAGSGTGQSQTGIETDVAMIGMRAYHMYNVDGTTSTYRFSDEQAFKFKSSNYQPQANLTTSVEGSYKALIEAINANIPGTDNDFAVDKGCLLDYDLSDMPDGLIRIDVGAVDMVQNSGFTDGGAYSDEYGNAWASLFVIKDSTPPDASVNNSYVTVDTSAASHVSADGWFNEATFAYCKIKGDVSSITDSGHARLRSPHDSMKWIVKPTSDTSWINSVSSADPAWRAVTTDYAPFPLPGNEGAVYYTYALMDDMGNISSASGIPPLKFDSVAPVVGTPYLVAAPGFTAGVAMDNILDEQTLVIPVTEITSGLKSIEVKVRKAGATEDYASPLSDPGLVVTTAGVAVPFTLDDAKKIITYNQPQTGFDSSVTIRGLKLSDSLTEQGSFNISVVVKDAAAADGVHEPVSVGIVSNTDSVAPVINQIYIPNVKATERFAVSGTEYWIDYNSLGAGTTPRTDVYVTFTEETSGAKIFDFTGSEIHLTGDSAIYRFDPATNTVTTAAIGADVDTAANKMTITSSVDAVTHFAGTGQVTVKITNVELAAEGTASTVTLKIYDTATNASAPVSVIKSNEGSLNLTSSGVTTSSFKFDSAAPVSTGIVLKDRKAEYKDLSNEFIQPETGFTNKEFVNARIAVETTTTNSGIDSLTISGDAEFDATTEIWRGSTISATPDSSGVYPIGSGTQIAFDITNSNKTLVFKTASGAHLVLGDATLVIKNLKLTGSDGVKTVVINPRSFSGVQTTTGASYSITLDRAEPEWNGKGLYSRNSGSVSSLRVYPHSVAPDAAASAYGIGLGTYYGGAAAGSGAMEDLYFYTADSICIGSDYTDSNPNTIKWKQSTDSTSAGSASISLSSAGVWTAIALDKAGNKSIPVKFNIVADSSFASDTDCANIYNYMVLHKPEGAFIHRNAANGSGIYKYVIKQNAQYQIKVKLGGTAPETGEEAIGGGAPSYTSGTPYNRKDNTTTSSKIEKYFVSTSTISPAYSNSSWVSYTTGSTGNGSFLDDTVTTSVDADGTITINLPQTNCSPLVLHLLDGCGNPASMLVKATTTDTHGVEWLADNEVGSAGEGLTGSPTRTGTYTNHSDVSFYNSTVTLKMIDLTESCRFYTTGGNTPSFPTYSTDPSFTYTMKSRIIAWTDSGKPDRDNFGNNDGTTYKAGITPPPAASDWCFVKQSSDGNYPVFWVENNFPEVNVTTKYRLFLILEDTVGNYEIRQIRRLSNGSLYVNKLEPSSSEIQDWYYDATPPTVTAAEDMTYNKINHDTQNYYSKNSSVIYTVSDSGSGVYRDGYTAEGYGSFGSRPSSSVTYSLNGKTPNSSHELVIPAADIEDYAGNTYTSDIKLKYGGSDQWVYLPDCPELASNAAVAVNKLTPLTPNLGLTDNTTTSANTTTGGPGGQKLELTAKWGVTDITVRLSTTTAQADMLGWVVSESPVTVSESDFYTSAQVSPNVTWDSTNSCWKYDYSKALSADVLWQSKADLYFYPVNKAGLIGQSPVLVHFKDNNPPTISNGTSASGYTYTANGDIGIINPTYLAQDKVADYKIKVSGTGSTAINYTRVNASVTFTTTENPTKYRFVDSGPDGQLGTSDDTYGDYTDTGLTVSDSSFTISLNSVTGNALGIQLARYNAAGDIEEDSAVYPLYGPTFSGHTGSNNWVYDSQSPGIAFVNTNPIMSGSASGTVPATFTDDALGIQYIEDATVYIKFTLTYKTASDRYQWKTKTYDDSTGSWSGWTTWSDFYYNGTATGITSFNTSSGELTFPAPESKTQYAFRVIDAAGNISSEDTTAKLQRDQWAPEAAGGLEYQLKNGTENVTTAGMDIPYNNAGTEDADTRVISYSKAPKLQDGITNNPYYINSIYINLSNVTDKRNSSGNVALDGIERSGIQTFEVYKESYLIASPDKNSTDYEITDLNSNDDNTVYTYELKVVDNLGHTKTLKTFRTNADGTAPDLALKTGAGLVQKASDESGSSAVDCDAKDVSGATDNGIYYLNTDYAIINLTKTATDVFKYQVTTNGGTSWTDITPVVNTTGSTHTVKYIFATPETATSYQFRAIDGVGNDSAPTSAITIRKDAAAPSGDDNTVGWAFYKDNGATAVGEDYYDITNNGTESKSITYNGGQMNKFELALSAIENAAGPSGIRRYWLTTDSGTPDDSTGNLDFDATNKKWKFTIADSGSTQVTYKIRAEDWAGNFTEFREFKLTPDVEDPVISFAATNKVPGAAEIDISSTTVYFLNAASTNAVINLSSASTDIKEYKVIIDGTESTITTESGLSTSPLSYTFAANTLTSQKVFSFKVIDKVGHEATTTDTVTLVQDSVVPELKSGVAALTLAVLKADGSDALRVSASDKIANYIRTDSADEVTSTITYNPDVVKTIAFNNLENELSEYNTSATVSGFEKLYYKTADGELQPMGGTGFNEITLGNNWNDTYYIYAKDKAGNQSGVLKTLVLTADSTAELNSDYVTTDGSVKKIHSYTAVNASDVGIDTIHWAYTNKIGDYQKANIFTSGTKIMYAKTDLPGIVQYMLVRKNNTGDYDATASGEWLDVSDGTADNSGSNFIFPLPDIKTANTRIAFYFRDAVGNQSGPYYLGNKSSAQFGIQWWMTTPALTADNITIESVTYSGGSGWAGTKKDYTVTVQLPAGTVINSVFLGPKPNGGNTGFVLSTSLNKFEFSGYGTGTGYTATKESYTKDANDPESGGYLILPSSEGSETGEITIGVYPWDSITAYSEPVIKFNGANIDAEGVSKQIFTDPNAGGGGGANPNVNGIGAGGSGIFGETSVLSDSSEQATGSRVIKFFSNMFSNDEEEKAAVTTGTVEEKPVETSKKVAKKAKKTSKKAAPKANKKMSEKVLPTESTIPMAVETKPEPVVNEIAEVTETITAVEPAAKTSVESTTGNAEAPQKKSPSRSASIVIMLAILSSLSGLWYYQKGRKK